MKQRGKLYGVGVGPGDPELMTVKAIRTIERSDVIVVPGKNAEDSVAYRIAAGICENLTEKQLIAVEMPMVKDEAVLEAGHRTAAAQIEALLDAGLTVSFLNLGDVTVYATYMYVHQMVKADGYDTAIINGITSFTAAAALSMPPTASWSVSANAVRPFSTAFLTSSSGENVPSEKVECVCKSTVPFVLFIYNLFSAYILIIKLCCCYFFFL